jgi:SAM-dependent methyltransferase
MAQPTLPIHEMVPELLGCARCKGALLPPSNDSLRCADVACQLEFPIVAGKPVLIDEARSLFEHDDYRGAQDRHDRPVADLTSRLRKLVRWLPRPSVNLSAGRCFETMKRRLRGQGLAPVILVVGGGTGGKGTALLHGESGLRIINVDPSPQSSAALFCDAHDLPFRDGTVDGVVIQAVLEHVVDPFRCVEEIHRVLRADGLVYSEIPFLYPAHERGFDFTRWTHLGHRRLFRRFSEIESGAVAGPATALAGTWRHFLACFGPSHRLARKILLASRVTTLALEQIDRLFDQRPAALDSAACTYFLGIRSEQTLSDKALVAGYRGMLR